MKHPLKFIASLLLCLFCASPAFAASFPDWTAEASPADTDYTVGYRPPWTAGAERRFSFLVQKSYFTASMQPLDADLTLIAGAAGTQSTAYGRASLSLVDAAAGRTYFGVVIGTNVQAWSANLDAWSAIAPASKAPASHTHLLSEITQSGATTGQIARWNGSAWAPFTLSGGGDLLAANNLSEIASAAGARINLGATTAGANVFTITNPGAISFLRFNADNSVSTRTAAQFKTDLAIDNLDNTSDANKPISTATQTALDAKLFSSRVAKTSAYTVVAGDRGKLINTTSGTFSLSLTAAATLGDGFSFAVWNSGSGTITLDPNGSETIRDAAGSATTKTLAQGESGIVSCDGSGFLLMKVTTGSSASTLTGTPLDKLATGYLLTTHRPAAGNYFVSFPAAGTAQTVEEIAAGNAGLITSVQMSLEGGAASFDARLRVYVDQELVPSIDVDVGTLFVSHLDAHTGAGWMYGTDHIQGSLVGSNTTSAFTPVNTDVSYQLQFPIPYSNGIKIEIYTPVGVTPSSPGYLFCSVFRRENVTSNLRLRSQGVTRFDANAGSAYAGASDVAMFDIPNNAGWAVWMSTAIFGATNYTYLERPWKWFVNGESTPSFIYTGGEEQGASGWYFGANTRASTPGILLGTNNNASFTAVFGTDILKMHGGVKFDSQLKLIWGNKPGFTATTNHKFGWCVLYYVDTTVAFAPTAPRSVTSSPGNTQGTVTWVAPASIGSQKITGYTVTLSPGGATDTVAANVLTKTFTGLTNGTAYTPTVTATNSVGTSSGATGSAFTPTAVTVPGAPTGATASAGNASATVTFTAPGSNGGSVITGYTATSSPGGLTGSISGATAAPITVAGLTNGVAYTFTVHATNAIGNSLESSASNSVTPSAVLTFITSETIGTLRSDATLEIGIKFTVGASPITVTELGRYMHSGNNQAHNVRLYSAGGTLLESVSVNMTGGTIGQYKYTALGTPRVLSASTVYYLMCEEANGADTWSNNDMTATANAAVTLNLSAYRSGGVITDTVSSNPWGPMNFKF